MPAWLLMALLKYIAPIVVEELFKLGHINSAEDFAAKWGLKAVAKVEELKSYHEDSDFPHPPPKQSSNNNINRGL